VEVASKRITDDRGTHSLIVPVWLYHESSAGKKRMVYALLTTSDMHVLPRKQLLIRLERVAQMSS
jgi:hypothetical protein